MRGLGWSVYHDGVEDGKRIGKKEGIEEGIEEGIKEGKKEERAAIVKAMHEKGIDAEQIAQIIQIPIEEVKDILEE